MSTLKVGEIKHESFTGTTQLKLDSAGRLLVGTATEGASGADQLTVASSSHGGVTIRSSSTSNGNLMFSDGTSGAAEYAGYVQYEHDNNKLNIGANGSTRLSIDSSGNVKIGTGNLKLDANQNISYKVQVGDVSNDNFTSLGHELASNSGDPIRGFVAQNNNGGIIENLQGSINQFLFLGDTDYQQSDKTLLGVSTNSGSTYYKRLDLSGTGILTIGDGIKFNNDTAAANKLDDYEEGTWTATLSGHSSPTNVATNNPTTTRNVTGTYRKIGSLVYVQALWNNLQYQGSNDMHNHQLQHITGLPFTSGNATGTDKFTSALGYSRGIYGRYNNSIIEEAIFYFWLGSGSTTVYLQASQVVQNSPGTLYHTVSNSSSSMYYAFNMTYHTN